MNLKKLLLICLSALSISAFAQSHEGLNKDWVPVVTNSDASQTHHVNLKSIERNGQIVKVWTASTGSKGKDSTKVLREFNCKTNQYRFLSWVAYKDAEFTQIDLSNHSPSSWDHLIPDSIAYVLKDFVCKTK